MDRLGRSSARIALVNSSRDPGLCNQVHSFIWLSDHMVIKSRLRKSKGDSQTTLLNLAMVMRLRPSAASCDFDEASFDWPITPNLARFIDNKEETRQYFLSVPI